MSVVLDKRLKALPRKASTAVLLDKQGVRYAVYHVTPSGGHRWQHAIGSPCVACPMGGVR